MIGGGFIAALGFIVSLIATGVEVGMQVDANNKAKDAAKDADKTKTRQLETARLNAKKQKNIAERTKNAKINEAQEQADIQRSQLIYTEANGVDTRIADNKTAKLAKVLKESGTTGTSRGFYNTGSPVESV